MYTYEDWKSLSPEEQLKQLDKLEEYARQWDDLEELENIRFLRYEIQNSF